MEFPPEAFRRDVPCLTVHNKVGTAFLVSNCVKNKCILFGQFGHLRGQTWTVP
ncbi:hypothetical protein DPMN_019923 [Dreissena polymorpha]|uniref:Uncharacterized protein n=1 Tax=Dreissena polymorpha TaxID=45954 RepID=A0A9D4NFV9_DREPO|nr:hypothetical protein DPMN_019923 [Dreissena polymorpha]